MDSYSPKYLSSRALIIGIDKYRHIGPLSYAVSDALSIKGILNEKFGFAEENIKLLTNEAATRDGIMKAYLSFTGDACVPDDRLLVFFAGHGFTQRGRRGEIGYLVPIDGNLDDLSSLVRWRELTDNSELIQAKHVLFIMDACYGGLALTRAVPAGGLRFLGDMLRRYSRQVLTAGKGNEVVADAGGPIPDHSIFTGHLLEALSGKAKTGDGILTANGVMTYVYERVSKDPNSSQTPHFGFLDGDGDFIFEAPSSVEDKAPEKDEDVLVDVPTANSPATSDAIGELIEEMKKLLSDDRNVIHLHDLVNREIRNFLGQTADDAFPSHSSGWSVESLVERLTKYEAVSSRIQVVASMMAFWGTPQQRPLIEKIFSRMSDRLTPAGGLTVWLALRRYPLMLLAYSSGISAIAGSKYKNLATIFLAKMPHPDQSSKTTFLTSVIANAAADLDEAFKKLPGHDRFYAPRSEYLHKKLQPILDDLLFLGRDYEKHFDRFEIIFGLSCANNSLVEGGYGWGPLGRFGWKGKRGIGENPFAELLAEADRQKAHWPPIQAGLFQGDYNRFSETAEQFKQIVAKLSWF